MISTSGPLRIRWLLVTLLAIGCCIGCQSLRVEEEAPQTIAVWNLDHLGQAEFTAYDMGELLAGKVIEALTESGKWIVVEREQLILALEELNLGSTSIVSESTVLEIGKIVGAQYMVFGTFIKVQQSMHLNLRLVVVASGLTMSTAEKTTSEEDIGVWLDTAKEATNDLQSSFHRRR